MPSITPTIVSIHTLASISNVVYEKSLRGGSGNAMRLALEFVALLQRYDDENCNLIKRSNHCYGLKAFGFGIILLQRYYAKDSFRHEEMSVSCFAQVLGHLALKSSYINCIGVLHENLRTSKNLPAECTAVTLVNRFVSNCYGDENMLL